MILTCNRCGFTFTRRAEPRYCPDCGRECVRPATELESLAFRQQMDTFQDDFLSLKALYGKLPYGMAIGNP